MSSHSKMSPGRVLVRVWVQQMVAEGRAICIMPERSAVIPGIATRRVEGISLERELVFVTVSGSSAPLEIRQIAQMGARHDRA
jgi:LysR family hydrogen peroxide-inducible transcriptional activator